ncbi:MAG: 4a-hydroxytetrahydrobiopterin dehydratase [Armatimonadota bacterium]
MGVTQEIKLAQEKTQPPQAGQQPLSVEEAKQLASQVPQWKLGDDKLTREYRFADFDEAIDFVNELAHLAKAADHHPDIQISYNKVKLTLSTHKIGGLSRNDFIVAARVDELA